VKSQLSGAGNLDAVWSPDGKRIAYTSVRNGKYAFFAKAADGMLLQVGDTVENL
jgi:Tol biopolymer transport system component